MSKHVGQSDASQNPDDGMRENDMRIGPESGEASPSEDVTRELFERAVQEHSKRLLAIARGIVGYRASPEDVVQQAIMNLYQHRHRYDWREPGGLLRRGGGEEGPRVLCPPRMGGGGGGYPLRAKETPRPGNGQRGTGAPGSEGVGKTAP